MQDFENESKQEMEGNLEGFDSVQSNDQNDSFYNHKKQDIIQDEILFQSRPLDNSGNSSFVNNNEFYNKPQKTKKTKRYGIGVVVLAIILSAIIGAVGGSFSAIYFTRESNGNTDSKPNQMQGSNININIDETVESIAEAVAKKASVSVVGIRTTTSVMSFFGGASESSGEGSGVIYSKDGYIITNYHVISEAITSRSGSKIEVFIGSANSNAYTASVVGYNISADLAVIKIDANSLTPIELADSEKLNVGQQVVTIGNPGGLEFMGSVTYGVISGLNRVVSADSGIELIQTDAAINPGNSGGALLNTKGQLIGINSSKIVSEQYEGMGFAIPVNTVVKICDNIISKQNSPEPYVGITISEKYSSSVLNYYGFPAGAVVLSVMDGSPADKAGIEKGDIITEFNGTKISEYQIFENLVSQSSPDETVSVKFYRNGKYYNTTIKIGSNS